MWESASVHGRSLGWAPLPQHMHRPHFPPTWISWVAKTFWMKAKKVLSESINQMVAWEVLS